MPMPKTVCRQLYRQLVKQEVWITLSGRSIGMNITAHQPLARDGNAAGPGDFRWALPEVVLLLLLVLSILRLLLLLLSCYTLVIM